jgi:predicted glycosyl hydrolase (DUF1957 family)
MNYLDRKYDKFLNEKSHEILKKNENYINAEQKADKLNKELNKALKNISEIIRKYDDALTEIGCVMSEEYYKQGFKRK